MPKPIHAPRPPRRRPGDTPTEPTVLAVYAPLGTDRVLSAYPNATPAPIRKQALVRALQKVAAQGTHVSALIDLHEDDTWLLEISAGNPASMSIHSTWKQNMSAPQALAGFLRRTHERFGCSTLVLAIEGHGGGFVPDIDPSRITPASVTHWDDGTQHGEVRWVQDDAGTHFETPPGSPALPMASPMLPMASPMLPAAGLPMSTWALGDALRSAVEAGVPAPVVIHFNNCFNMSAELLHTVAPWARHATGYANYDFFTAGEAYPRVFSGGPHAPEALARRFAAENAALLSAKGNHPTVGATIELARMKEVASAIDALSTALIALLRPANAADRPAALARIEQAVADAQHYDTEQGFELRIPDQFIDLGSLAARLEASLPAGAAQSAATALLTALDGTWQYGDRDRPWLDENQIWDFRDRRLGLNILFPDPGREGRWDWRSPYYLSGTVDPAKPPAHRHVIDFLADRPSGRAPWVAFIDEYHRDVPFVGFLPARPPLFPVFDRRFKPTLPHPDDDPHEGKPDEPPRRPPGAAG